MSIELTKLLHQSEVMDLRREHVMVGVLAEFTSGPNPIPERLTKATLPPNPALSDIGRGLMEEGFSRQGRLLLALSGLWEQTPSPFTPRESEVLQHLAAGLRQDEIADTLIVGLPTIKSHVTSMRRKMQVASSPHLVFKAVSHDLVDTSEVTEGYNFRAFEFLTPVERNILAMTVDFSSGSSKKKLSRDRETSLNTTRFHIRNIFSKLRDGRKWMNTTVAGVLYLEAQKRGVV